MTEEYSIHIKGDTHTIHGNFKLMENLAASLPESYLGEGCLIIEDPLIDSGDWHFIISCVKIGTPVSS
jgi:hypothetical protein